MVVLKSKHNERQEMNQLTTDELKVISLAMVSEIIGEKDKLARLSFTDDYTLEVVKNLRKLQSVYEKFIEIERQALRAEQNK